MINHVSYEIDGNLVEEEVAFWSAIGWEEVMIRSRTAPKTRWLRTPVGEGAIHIHLIPAEDWDEIELPTGNHVCVIPPGRIGGYTGAIRLLEGLPFAIAVEEAEPWWGARRMFAWSPSGYGVELLEHAPPAGRPLPPSQDN